MFAVLAHAKDDPGAPPVAQALGDRVLARIVIGERAGELSLGHMTAIVVWSALAAGRTRAELFDLCAHVRRVILVRTDDTPWPADLGVQADAVDWRSGGLPAVLAAIEASREAKLEASKRSPLQAAAGALAIASALAPTAGGAAPAAMPRSVHETRNGARVRRQGEQAAATEAVAASAYVHAKPAAELDLDALPPPAENNPEVSARELLKHAPRTHADFPEPRRQKVTLLELGPLSIRI